MNFPIGLQLYSVRDDLEKDFEGTLRKVKALGYDAVEFAGLFGHGAEEVRNLCKEIGLIPLSAHVPFVDMMNDPDGVLKVYADIGCKFVVIPYLTEEYRPGQPKFQEVIDGAKLLGLHIEGPYIAKSQCGAQDPRFIRNPDPAEYNELLNACPHILRWTIAPELPGAREMGLALLARGVLPSIGHSEADSEAVRAAIPCGYRHVTHLYSAMSTIVRKAGFRHAGIVESAYLYDELSSEIIADGCHLPAPLLQLAYKHIGPRRLVLVTDAMRGAGQTQGESILGSLENGQRVILEDGVAKMPDRTAFAGSICTADRLVRTMVTLAGASLPDAVRMITETPARVLGLSDFYGRVEAGRAADLAVFDHTIRIAMVLKDGAVCFENREEALP